MGKAKSNNTSKVKLANKSSNKRMKASRRHKLNKQTIKQKEVNIPSSLKAKQKQKKLVDEKSINKIITSYTESEDLDNYDVEFSDDEMAEFVQENTENLSFLSASFESGGNKTKKKRSDEEVADYEKAPRMLSKMSRSNDDQTNKVDLLPIKGENGIIKRSADRVAKVIPEEQQIEQTEENNESDDKKNVAKPQSFVELLANHQIEINQKKLQIGQISQDILENPDLNINLLKQLLSLCGRNQAMSIRKLALLSLLEVFKDIIPSYRIRELSDEEKYIKVSKDVRKIRDFEETLLSSYQNYLQMLEDNMKDCLKLIKRKRTNGVTKSIQISFKPMVNLATLSITCLAELLKTVPHFNFRTNIIAVLVPKMELSNELAEAKDICVTTVISMFKWDNTGEISLEIVKVIHRLVKSKPNVDPKVLETLLSLRINPDIIRTAAMKSNKIERLREKREAVRKMSRKERKRKKVEEKLTKELQEAEAVECRDKLEKVQTEIVKFIFVIYFRILKSGQNTPLLSAVLRGLSKFAHLINVEFFDDLMSSLQRIMSNGDLGLSENLNCILTALRILSGQGESLTIDPREFYTMLYNLLLSVASDSDETDLELTKECLNVLLLQRRKQVSLPQVLGFFKRLATVLLQLKADKVIDFVLILRNILQLHKNCDYLLDNETFGCGIFQPEVSDPEHSNANSTALWEITLLLRHYQPELESFSKHILAGCPSQGIGSLSAKLSHRTSIYSSNVDDLSEYFPDFISKNSSEKFHRNNEHIFKIKDFQSDINIKLETIEKLFGEYCTDNS